MTSVTASLYPCSTSLNHLLMAVISNITSATFRVNLLVPSKREREPYKSKPWRTSELSHCEIPTRGTGSKLQLQLKNFYPKHTFWSWIYFHNFSNMGCTSRLGHASRQTLLAAKPS